MLLCTSFFNNCYAKNPNPNVKSIPVTFNLWSLCPHTINKNRHRRKKLRSSAKKAYRPCWDITGLYLYCATSGSLTLCFALCTGHSFRSWNPLGQTRNTEEEQTNDVSREWRHKQNSISAVPHSINQLFRQSSTPTKANGDSVCRKTNKDCDDFKLFFASTTSSEGPRKSRQAHIQQLSYHWERH